MTLSALWDLLSQVKTLNLHAVSFEPQKPEWRGEADGRVILSKVNPDTLVFSESGEWNFTEKPKIKFFNIYRWRLADGETLELSHLRNGMDFPVHLLDFKESVDGNWNSGKPHLCNEDVYAAILSVKEGLISVKWSIDGPAKRQVVECFYAA